ncbi:hypothetical protein [Bacillus paralicheniformis]|uniref:hypothetical protein n=1 Tax=Bacillus paralicheniformis TaxID=1648923 RepID=UPI0029026CE2|nr:hypothetical protein [Bacillus paralicheniformis]MDU0414201.1 hypothetical protein [Bacillus paralicheniformis]
MNLFQLHQQDMKEIREIPFEKEKDIQHLCEKNLKQLLGLKFIASEFRVAGFRIDTLAFDDQTQSFVIIEYKNKNISNISLIWLNKFMRKIKFKSLFHIKRLFSNVKPFFA